MLSEKHLINKTHQPKGKFVTVIHPEKLTSITDEKSDRESLVSWLFLIGSLMFLVDGLIELNEGISIHVLLHLPASIMFVVGSVLFMPTQIKSRL